MNKFNIFSNLYIEDKIPYKMYILEKNLHKIYFSIEIIICKWNVNGEDYRIDRRIKMKK